MELIKHQEIESRNTRKQKYDSGTIVRLKRGFYYNHLAVIEYTYAQRYGGDDYKNYSVVVLNKDCYPINSMSWMEEEFLEFVSDDVEYGLKIIEYYKNKEK